MSRNLKTANVRNCLMHLGNCINHLPGTGETITQEHQDKINLAKKALQHLDALFSEGTDDVEIVGCKPQEDVTIH